ncbi:MAG: TetR/AcrR family transcriptional regulator [Sphingopyxis solisilvae]|uniref:TetR/AcrR family transcriptional regulator n=1 Tax=Sphingopyxis solisilvae TaxID=1886788 RepID=UPI004035BDD7
MSDRSTSSRRGRFAKADWIVIGLAGLRQEGPDALTIERLTATARRTRGSFYHHFASHEDFVRAMADSWLQQSTVGPIAEMQQAADMRRVRASLAEFAATLDHRLERQIRRLGEINTHAHAVVQQSDALRIAMLVQMFQDEFALLPDEALKRAQLQHAAFVGMQVVFPEASPEFRRELDLYLAGKLWVG